MNDAPTSPVAGAFRTGPLPFAPAPGIRGGDVAANSTAAPAKPLRIRTGHSYHVYFSIALGQGNARFVERAMTPLARYLSWADAVTFTPEPGFDALHTWNAVPLLTRRPFITTFEDYMPRTPDDRRIGWLERVLRRRLLSDQCVALIALSDYALRQFRAQHAGFDRLPELLAKTERIYPVAAPRRDAPKAHSDRLRLLFVGRDFMRKGGPVLLEAHRALRKRGVPVETTVVSSLQWSADDYVGPPDADYVAAAAKGLDQEGIQHHRSLPNPAVNALMEAADYLVFPTFHDTFGFVALEALAAATPVIATDTCVLPEVVASGENGFLLPFENDPVVGKWTWLYRQREAGYLDAYDAATGRLSAALADTLEQAWEARSGYEALSAGALAAARDRFHPDIARRRLEALYERLRLR
jgi:glycosyltransferase involved in cell wall biosynthesis